MRYVIWLFVFTVIICQTTSFLFINFRSRLSRRCAAIAGSNNVEFSQFPDIPKWLISNCARLGFNSLTDIQRKALPAIFDGKDVILQSPTGSGKTLTFALPILSKIDAKRRSIQAVIVVPTRELCLQIEAVFEELVRDSPMKIDVMSVMEGSKNKRQIAWATSRPPAIVVGNPSALQVLVDKGHLKLRAVSYIVLDEVDACLMNIETRKELHHLLSRHLSKTFVSQEMEDNFQWDLVKPREGFRNLAKNVRTPDIFRGTRRAIMCSATIPQRQYFAQLCKQNGWTETVPELILVNETVPVRINHYYAECESDIESRIKLMSDIVAKEIRKTFRKGITTSPLHSTSSTVKNQFQAIVFCGSDDNMLETHKVLTTRINLMKSKGVIGADSVGEVKYMTESGMYSFERTSTINAFRNGNCSILVCSANVIARGLDIPDTTHIFQLKFPENSDDYLHQSGRTGRFGRAGSVITLIPPIEKRFVIPKLQNVLGINFKNYAT